MSSRAFLLVLSMLAVISRTASSLPATWYVDASMPGSGDGVSWERAFKTIQEGIDAATDGDVIIVAEGVYLEKVHFGGKNIVLRSTDPLDWNVVANTIIDGSQSDSVVTFAGTENETCVLSGFTIRNGLGETGGGIRGGTLFGRSRPLIQCSVITGNSCWRGGGGLANCDGIIENNVITANSAHWDGGGLNQCDGTIRNNRITGNSADDEGGGLWKCNGIIENNLVSENWAGEGGGGLAWCGGTIRNNIILGNRAGEGGDERSLCGGGLAWCNGVIRSNAIFGNSAIGGGGGLALCHGDIANNTVAANRSLAEAGGTYRCYAIITNCVIWGNSAPGGLQISHPPAGPKEIGYCCIEGWTGDGEGNIALGPRFVDPDGSDDDPETWEDNDYRLLPDSPCIDAGLNQGWMLNATDIVGNPRICQGSRSLTVDIGAYEYFRSSITKVRRTSEGEIELTWTSRPGDEYTVWSCWDLANGAWQKMGTTRAEEPWTSWMDASGEAKTRFFRIGWTE